jgi:hypothetical protein
LNQSKSKKKFAVQIFFLDIVRIISYICIANLSQIRSTKMNQAKILVPALSLGDFLSVMAEEIKQIEVIVFCLSRQINQLKVNFVPGEGEKK